MRDVMQDSGLTDAYANFHFVRCFTVIIDTVQHSLAVDRKTFWS